ncbi:MAG: hypothetical protein K8I82_06540, partial [Anaerolineae bacterium]|nr:hypothetical protein [Anaerolineae bacterium]
TLSSIATIEYFQNKEVSEVAVSLDGLPTTLEDSIGLVSGFWIAGLLVGLSIRLLGWGENGRSIFASSLMGFAIATLIRIMALGIFLPNATNFWKFMSGILSLHDIPDYHAFLLLVWVGGATAVAAGVQLGVLIQQKTAFTLPTLDVEPQNLLVSASLMSVLLLSLLVIRNLDSASRSDLSILNTRWLILPVTNMILAALMGFFIGGGYFTRSPFAAGATVFLGAAVHVTVMLVLESYVSTFDAVEASTDLNNLPVLNFIFFWAGTPVVGAVAALALHNLRDAFSINYEEEAPA